MLEGRQALDLALDLARMPTLAGAMRAQPLPSDTLVVIRIAAGCLETCRAAEAMTSRSPTSIKEACVLYIQQILLTPQADSHRVLGLRPGASRKKMREHMRWLLKWLHPDTNQNEWESVYAERVLRAWRDPDNKKDRLPGPRSPGKLGGPQRRSHASTQRLIALPLKPPAQTYAWRRMIVFAFIGILGAIGVTCVLSPSLLSATFAAHDVESVAETEN